MNKFVPFRQSIHSNQHDELPLVSDCSCDGCQRGDKSTYFTNICAWLRDEGLKVNAPVDRYDGWRMVIVAGPTQDNGSDCGVFTIMAAEMCMLDLPLIYDQPMMPDLRLRIAHELIEECLI